MFIFGGPKKDQTGAFKPKTLGREGGRVCFVQVIVPHQMVHRCKLEGDF